MSNKMNITEEMTKNNLHKKLNIGDYTKMNSNVSLKRAKLKTLNEHITCFICNGYFVEATTINECVHTFCRSCIVRHFQRNKGCPRIGCSWYNAEQINISSLRVDTAMRALVYKMVPGLYQSENQRLVNFQIELNNGNNCSPENLSSLLINDTGDFYSPDEPISLSLEYDIANMKSQDPSTIPSIRYLQCPAAVTVKHLKRFITCKFDLNVNSFVIDIVYENDILPVDFSLMDVAYCYKWKRFAPMKFFYRIYEQVISRKDSLELITSEITTNSDVKPLTPSTSATTTNTTGQTDVSTNYNNSSNSNNKTIIKIEKLDSSNDNFNLKKKIKIENSENILIKSDSNISDSLVSNFKINSNKLNISNATKSCSVKIKEMKCEDEIIMKGGKFQQYSNKIEIAPIRTSNDFKILRSNDTRHTHLKLETKPIISEVTPKHSKNENLKRSYSTPSSSSTPVASKQKKILPKKSSFADFDDFDDDDDDDDDDTDDTFVPPKSLNINRRSETKPRYITDNDSKFKPTFTSYDFDCDDSPPLLRMDSNARKYSKKTTNSSANKEMKKIETKSYPSVPKCEIDLPNLKAKIIVPKNEKSSPTSPLSLNYKKFNLQTIDTTSDDNKYSIKQPQSAPILSENELNSRNQIEYAENIGLQPNMKHDDLSNSTHRKRKKAKHSKDDKGSSGKRRKIHAEISSQDESLKVKVKLLSKSSSHKSDRKSTSDENFSSSQSSSSSPPSSSPIITSSVRYSPERKDEHLSQHNTTQTVDTINKEDEVITQKPSESIENLEKSIKLSEPKVEIQIKPENQLEILQIKPEVPIKINQIPNIPSQQVNTNVNKLRPIQPKPPVKIPQLKSERDCEKKDNIEDVEEIIKGNKIIKQITVPEDQTPVTTPTPVVNKNAIVEKQAMVNIPNLNPEYLENKKDSLFLSLNRSTNQKPIKRSPGPINQTQNQMEMFMNQNLYKTSFTQNLIQQTSSVSMPKPIMSIPQRPRLSLDKKPQQTQIPPSMNMIAMNSTFNKQNSNQQRLQSMKSPVHVINVDNYESIKSPKPVETIDITSSQDSNKIQKYSLGNVKKVNDIKNNIQHIQSKKPSNSAGSIYKPLIGSSYIQENHNKKPLPISLPPSSVSVTKMSDNVKTSPIRVDSRPSLEIVRISSSVPAIDQQVKSTIPSKVPSSKPNRPPPPLIKRTPSSNGNLNSMRKLVNNQQSTTVKSSGSDTTGPLDLSGKQANKSPTRNDDKTIKPTKSRSNSVEEVTLISDSSNDTVTQKINLCKDEKIENKEVSNISPTKLSKQKKITDMFPSSAWSVNKMNTTTGNSTSPTKNQTTTNNSGNVESKSSNVNDTGNKQMNGNTLKLLSTQLSTLTQSTYINTKPTIPKLTEMTKIRQQINPTVRQQNLSMRNVPNPSALAFRGQQQSNNNNHTNNTSCGVTSSTNTNTTITSSDNNRNGNVKKSPSTSSAMSSSTSPSTTTPKEIENGEASNVLVNKSLNDQSKIINSSNNDSNNNSNGKESNGNNKIINNNTENVNNNIKDEKLNLLKRTTSTTVNSTQVTSTTSTSSTANSMIRKNEFKGIEKVVANLKANAADSKSMTV